MALLVYPILTAVVVAIGSALGLIRTVGLSWSGISAVLQTSALGLAPQVLKNVFEETAWRGYLAPKVYGLGWNDYPAHAAVGLVWGAWHIPYYLYFLDRAVLQERAVAHRLRRSDHLAPGHEHLAADRDIEAGAGGQPRESRRRRREAHVIDQGAEGSRQPVAR